MVSGAAEMVAVREQGEEGAAAVEATKARKTRCHWHHAIPAAFSELVGEGVSSSLAQACSVRVHGQSF